MKSAVGCPPQLVKEDINVSVIWHSSEFKIYLLHFHFLLSSGESKSTCSFHCQVSYSLESCDGSFAFQADSIPQSWYHFIFRCLQIIRIRGVGWPPYTFIESNNLLFSNYTQSHIYRSSLFKNYLFHFQVSLVVRWSIQVANLSFKTIQYIYYTSNLFSGPSCSTKWKWDHYM